MSCTKFWTIVVNLYNQNIDVSNDFYIDCLSNDELNRDSIFSNIKVSGFPNTSNFLETQSTYLGDNLCCSTAYQTLGSWKSCKIPQVFNIQLELISENYNNVTFVRDEDSSLILDQNHNSIFTLPLINYDSNYTDGTFSCTDETAQFQVSGPKISVNLLSINHPVPPGK